ncbi:MULTISPECIES: fumarylacetoacetate hydrolase family protein [unclassified Sphingomonas]|uniref:fumarylacetoacetate hydrolase family protein n=1 Tax=unclassified Sphingomonas TaxID=196159 RepID=UPI0006F4C9DA|nr:MULTISPECIES: fumarylacetoacetate hydrolase family protein [unclassified Sphingomonas]KQX23310.1 fumarylacetoacetate hydrolase [Sphingomonas sp. Root1294]KQY68158.1 fumarylacetoacetate hydrolase [Sphingomonas sp. Root50]KRB91051.1 fumarylacetoacetate hydrolase [Sphingomonas sp. Root720]
MKLATIWLDGAAAPAIVRDGRAIAFRHLSPELPGSIEALFAGGEEAFARLRRAADRPGEGLSLDEVRLLAPLSRPGKLLGIGFNYASHVEEVRAKGLPIPDLRNQIWFNKQVSAITGPFDPIHLPAVSEQLDYECELGIVIGRRCRHVPEADARKVIAGYLVGNDVSVRDWQLKAPTATLGKSFDTHAPIGPWITTADEVAAPDDLAIRTLVDGRVVQDGRTSELVNGIDAMIAYLTQVMTLEPGDILLTGTPKGVAAGHTPPTWLREGQIVRVEIEGLGHLENRVVAEPLAETTFIQ